VFAAQSRQDFSAAAFAGRQHFPVVVTKTQKADPSLLDTELTEAHLDYSSATMEFHARLAYLNH